MIARTALLTLFLITASFSQSPFKDFSFGGSANDSIHGIGVDAAQNIYVAGTTFSADLPLLNAMQSVNTGTQLIYSTDAGATWKPLSSPFPKATPIQPLIAAVDPSNPLTVYVGSGPQLCKSVDGGHQFHCVAVSTNAGDNMGALVIDPKQPNTLFANAGALYKSTDAGQTWNASGNGLPFSAGNVSFDPFHPGILYAFAPSGGFVSQDGGSSWTQSTLVWPPGLSVGGPHAFVFDAVTPGEIYGPSAPSGRDFSFQRSIDGGQTWKELNVPFIAQSMAADPKTAGFLYALAPPTNAPRQNDGTPAPSLFWKSTDRGDSWTSSPVPAGASAPLSVDPANPQVILAGTFRTADGGKTWSPTNASRPIQSVFAPSAGDTVYAVASLSSDAFIAKFLPDGKTLVFATYFGGMGNEGVGSLALDASGNIWIAGSTSSYDLPVTPGAYQSSLRGSQNGFVAKFSNDGKLLSSSYLGGSKQDGLLGIAVSPQGNPWVIGSWLSTDFPFSAGP